MKALLLSMIFVLSACTSAPKRISKEVNDVKDQDFKKVKQSRYKKSADVLSDVKSKYSDVSNRESIDRVYKYDGDVELSGPMAKVAKLCYAKNFKLAYKIVEVESRGYLTNPIYWNQVGTCYLQEGNLRKALLFYNKALSLRKNYAPALNNLGVMYIKKGDHARALVAFEKARKTRSFSRVPRLNLANLYLSFGLFDHALAEVKVLSTLSKNDIDVLNMSATTKLMKNDIKSALKDFAKIDKDFWEHPKVGINFAMAVFLNGETKQAVDLFEDVEIDLDNNWKDYYLDVARILGVKL